MTIALLWLGGAIGFALGTSNDSPDDRPAPETADVGYLQDMITHHEQALEMAHWELVNGQDPSVQIFAREILEAQSGEIGLMEGRLQAWGYSRADRPDSAMAWMGMAMPVESMPGLATNEQMTELQQAQGTEADRLFLELMATHHRGGADMGLAAAERASDPWVVDLASGQARNQIIEIEEFIMTSDRLGLDAAIEPYE